MLKIKMIVGGCGLLALSVSAYSQTKTDLFGFTPGMTHEQARLVIAKRAHPCKFYKIAYAECIIDGAETRIVFSDDLPGNPLVKLYANLPGTPTVNVVSASITSQYGVSPSEVGKVLLWKLPQGIELKYDGQLSLIDPVLEQREKDAQKAASMRGTPKF